MHESSTHFEVLLEHLGAYSEPRRQRLAQLYEARSAEPMDIALQWCRHPDEFGDVLERELGDSELWGVLEQLVQEHDLAVDIGWVDRAARAKLTDLGLLKTSGKRRTADPVQSVPAAVAAMLSPRLSGIRPTLPVLLGRRPAAEVVALADQYAISTEGSTIEVILRISEVFAGPDFLDVILARLPNPDWIGAAMMTLELGGICYWREIFGLDLDQTSKEDNVVPLMRVDERDEQREIAGCLLDMGVLFKLEDDEADFALVALPEELWAGLWATGQSWLIDWTAMVFAELEEVAVRQPREPAGWDLQSVLKWLACEAASGRIVGAKEPSDASLEELRERSRGLDVNFEAAFGVGRDMGLVEPAWYNGDDGDLWQVGPFADDILAHSRAQFTREVLSHWMHGRVGTAIDRHAPQALGIDEQWRVHLLDFWANRDGRPRPWMGYEGVPHVETGAGCLREFESDDEDITMFEHGLLITCLRLTKLHFLDLLSLLEPDEWYSVAQLSELLQWNASVAIFSQIGMIIHDPFSSFYFPVQRPSFLSFPTHADAFGEWCRDILTNLLAPLGLAEVSEDGQRVWLDTRPLRIESPSDWPADPREEFVRGVLDDPDFELDIPEASDTVLRFVPKALEPDTLAIEMPIEELLDACEGRPVREFDGKLLRLD